MSDIVSIFKLFLLWSDVCLEKIVVAEVDRDGGVHAGHYSEEGFFFQTEILHSSILIYI